MYTKLSMEGMQVFHKLIQKEKNIDKFQFSQWVEMHLFKGTTSHFYNYITNYII